MANEHPIEGLMNATMDHLKEMIDVNTVVGKPIETKDGAVIIPISKVGFGFAAGGSEFNTSTLEETKKRGLEEENKLSLPFGGGSAAGVKIVPVGFLVITSNGAKMLPVDHCSAIDKLLDYVPEVIDKVTDFLGREKSYTYEFYENIGEDEKDNFREQKNDT